MKALFVNGSPRKKWTTVKLLESAMQGATDAGAEVELVHLYDAAFKGCVSCFACKLKNAKTSGLCAFKDALTPTLEKARDADVIVIGAPIYFSHATGATLAFMERLLFPWLTYDPKIDPTTGEVAERGMTTLDKFVPTGMIYSMGAPKEMTEQYHYPHILGENERFMKAIYGYCETLCSYCGYQFNDYSKYAVMDGVEEARVKYRAEELPKDLQNAYDLGKRLVETARK